MRGPKEIENARYKLLRIQNKRQANLAARYLTSITLYTLLPHAAVYVGPILVDSADNAIGILSDLVRLLLVNAIQSPESYYHSLIQTIPEETLQLIGLRLIEYYKNFGNLGHIKAIHLRSQHKPLALLLSEERLPLNDAKKFEIYLTHGRYFTLDDIRRHPLLKSLQQALQHTHSIGFHAGNLTYVLMKNAYLATLVGGFFYGTHLSISYILNNRLRHFIESNDKRRSFTKKNINERQAQLKFYLPKLNMALLAINLAVASDIYIELMNDFYNVLSNKNHLSPSANLLNFTYLIIGTLISPGMILIAPILITHLTHTLQSIYQRRIQQNKTVLAIDALNQIFKPLLKQPFSHFEKNTYFAESFSSENATDVATLLLNHDIFSKQSEEFIEIDMILYAQTILDKQKDLHAALEQLLQNRNYRPIPHQKTQKLSWFSTGTFFSPSKAKALKPISRVADRPAQQAIQPEINILISFGRHYDGETSIELTYDSQHPEQCTIVPVTNNQQAEPSQFVFIPPDCDRRFPDLTQAFRRRVLNENTKPSVKLVGQSGAGLKKLNPQDRYELKIKHKTYGNARFFESERRSDTDGKTLHIMGHLRRNGHGSHVIRDLPALLKAEIQRPALGAN